MSELIVLISVTAVPAFLILRFARSPVVFVFLWTGVLLVLGAFPVIVGYGPGHVTQFQSHLHDNYGMTLTKARQVEEGFQILLLPGLFLFCSSLCIPAAKRRRLAKGKALKEYVQHHNVLPTAVRCQQCNMMLKLNMEERQRLAFRCPRCSATSTFSDSEDRAVAEAAQSI